MGALAQKVVCRAAPVLQRVSVPASAAHAVRATGKPGGVQRATELRVSSPHDPAEREAERVARSVVRAPAPEPSVAPVRTSPLVARLARTIVQRATTDREARGPATAAPDVAAEISIARSGGAPLPTAVRRFMEPRFGARFDSVRIHTGMRAASLSRAVSARAFTVGDQVFFGQGQFRPDSDDGRELIAHELTHTIQQGATLQRSEDHTVTVRTEPQVQRLGMGDALDYFANKANILPGFRMFTIVLGVNPINMSPVDRSPANIIRAMVEFLPGGGLITQALDNYGIFDKVGGWVAQQIAGLGMVGGAFRQAITAFLDGLSWTDIFDLGGVWERARRIFTEPIERLIGFVKGLVTGILTFIRDAILMPIAALAKGTRGYDLLCVVLGKDPVTGATVPQTADALVGGFMKFIGQEDVWENAKKANAVARAFAWFKGAMAAVLGMVQRVPALFLDALRALEITDLVLVPRAFMKLAGVFGGFVGGFISWAGNAVWNLLEIVFDCVSPGALSYVKKTGAALKNILKNPLPFVGNLVRAAKLGFTNFAGNFLAHLKAGLIDWLTGSLPGVYIPQAFTLGEIVKFVFSVLGLTWQNVRAKLVKVVGETAVKAMETGFDIVVTLVTQGPAAAWDKIKDQLANLKDMVIGGITDLVVDTVVKKAIPKLVAMFIPGAGFLSAILSIYDTVMVFVQKLAKIVQVVTGFINSIVAIASGAIGAAAAKVESVLAGLLSLAISFLAGFAGLGNVASKIMGVIERVRAPIDKALDWLIGWIVAAARKLGRFIAQAGVPNDPNERLRLAVGAAATGTRALGAGVTRPLLQPLLSGIQVRYGLSQIEAFERGGTWWVRASINPTAERNMGIVAAPGTHGTRPPPSTLQAMPTALLKFKCNTLKYVLTTYQEQLNGQAAGLNTISVPDWLQNRSTYRNRDPVPQEAVRAEYRNSLAKQLNKKPDDPEVNAKMERLAALHEPDLVAGGFNVVGRLGSRYINSSIGAQWPSRVTELERKVDALKPNQAPYRIDVRLEAEAFTP